MTSIDLNADLGEGDDCDAELLKIVSTCNIACGGHTGDAESMATTLRLAIANGVVAGAHPGYPDPEGFGRVSGFLSGDALYESLSTQVTALADIAAKLGTTLGHVKAHGALYNDAVRDAELADIIARVTAELPGSPALVGMANSELESAAERHGLEFIAEAFVDRAYEPDATLVPRSEPGAVHTEAAVVSNQAVSLAKHGAVTSRTGEVINIAAETLCIHGDTPGAAGAARAVRDVLENRGVEIRAVQR